MAGLFLRISVGFCFKRRPNEDGKDDFSWMIHPLNSNNQL